MMNKLTLEGHTINEGGHSKNVGLLRTRLIIIDERSVRISHESSLRLTGWCNIAAKTRNPSRNRRYNCIIDTVYAAAQATLGLTCFLFGAAFSPVCYITSLCRSVSHSLSLSLSLSLPLSLHLSGRLSLSCLLRHCSLFGSRSLYLFIFVYSQNVKLTQPQLNYN